MSLGFRCFCLWAVLVGLANPSAHGFVDDPVAVPKTFARQVFEHLEQQKHDLPRLEYAYTFEIENNRQRTLPDGTRLGAWHKQGRTSVRRDGEQLCSEQRLTITERDTGKQTTTRIRYVLNDTLAGQWIVDSITAQVFEYESLAGRDAVARERTPAANVADPLDYAYDDPLFGLLRSYEIVKDRADREYRVRLMNDGDSARWVIECWGTMADPSQDDVVKFSEVVVDPNRDYLITALRDFHPDTGRRRRDLNVHLEWNEPTQHWLATRIENTHYEQDGSIKIRTQSELESLALVDRFEADQFGLKALGMNEGVAVYREHNNGTLYTDRVVNGQTQNIRKRQADTEMELAVPSPVDTAVSANAVTRSKSLGSMWSGWFSRDRIIGMLVVLALASFAMAFYLRARRA